MRDDNLMNGKLTRWLQAALALLLLIGSLANARAAGRDEIVFFFNDAQGSAVAAVSEQGDLCWSEQYTPYGDKTINDDLVSVPGCGIIGEERGFTGHTEDVNSDLVYMQQRYYDPSIGRFLSIDPIDPNPLKPQTLNRYAYANNNPYKYVDPDGQLPIAIVGVIAVGAALSAYDSYQAYQEGGASALAKTLIVETAMVATGAGKLGLKAGKLAKNVSDKPDDMPDFTVTEDGTSVPVSQRRMREGFDEAGFPSSSSKITDETAITHTVPTSRGPIDVRTMEGGANHPRRAVFSTPGQPRSPRTPDGGTPRGTKQQQRDSSHLEQSP